MFFGEATAFDVVLSGFQKARPFVVAVIDPVACLGNIVLLCIVPINVGS